MPCGNKQINLQCLCSFTSSKNHFHAVQNLVKTTSNLQVWIVPNIFFTTCRSSNSSSSVAPRAVSHALSSTNDITRGHTTPSSSRSSSEKIGRPIFTAWESWKSEQKRYAGYWRNSTIGGWSFYNTLNALKDSVTAHKPSNVLKQCIRHRRPRMAKVLPSLHYEKVAGEDRKDFPRCIRPGSETYDESIGRIDAR